MQKIHLTKINLNNYRNFEQFKQQLDNDLILITGPNGSGKTNILEAISYLSPGRGIRFSRHDDLCRDNIHSWQYQIELQSKLGIANIAYDFDLQKKKRNVSYNGSKISANELNGLANVIWLTPQMGGLFTGPRSTRLRFFDRIVFSFFKDHAVNLNKLEHFHKERLAHLTDNIGNFDDAWLSVLEKKITEYAMLIHQARLDTIWYMQQSIDSLDSEFPRAILSLTEIITSDIDKFVVEYRAILAENRKKDAYSGRTNFGVHRIDFIVMHAGKGKEASICSTGEQKAMLISIFLAQIEAIITQSSATPILLLDELFVHLDDLRKQYLSEYVIKRGVQTFITATDTYGIDQIAANSQRIII